MYTKKSIDVLSERVPECAPIAPGSAKAYTLPCNLQLTREFGLYIAARFEEEEVAGLPGNPPEVVRKLAEACKALGTGTGTSGS